MSKFFSRAEVAGAVGVGLMMTACIAVIIYAVIQISADTASCRERGGVWIHSEGVCVKIETLPRRL
jgi:hypothetical protein